jgi:hypothetical protein
MKQKLLFSTLLLSSFGAMAQPEIDSWIINTDGTLSSYWENIGGGGPPNYVFNTTTDSADVILVCYDASDVYIYSHGMTNDMGKYLNPGDCVAQDYIFRIPRVPTIPTVKEESPVEGEIGVLTNGIPIYGLSNANSWNGTTNAMGGAGVWNVEVYLAEGFVLDTAFGAHPQQEGKYHSHATPWRLYQDYPTNVHSPIVGYAFDGFPIYGPYGYSDAMNSSSAIERMETGYSLRSITTRTTLPDGSPASQTGPPVSGTYPLGTYIEDYKWDAANGGDLDEYNGRFCVTPEYPGGTYAYFVTMDGAGVPEFPYYIGIYYYGEPDTDNNSNMPPDITIPGSTSCVATGFTEFQLSTELTVFPNPNNGNFTIQADNASGQLNTIEIFNYLGEQIHSVSLNGASSVELPLSLPTGVYLVKAIDQAGMISGFQTVIVN